MAAKNFLSDIDLHLNQILNGILHKLSAAPAGPVEGQVYYNSTTKSGYVWNGSAWRPLDANQLADGSIQIAALATNPLARVNHTGTQTASTISDLATVVKAYTLDSFAAAVAALNLNGQKITNVATGTNSGDAVNKGQMDSAIAAAIAGQTAVKSPVRVVAASNIVLSGLPTIDGISIDAGDRVLCVGQTAGAENLIHVAAAGAWTVATDNNSVGQLIEGTDVLVNEGTAYGGAIFRVTTSGPITPGVTSVAWTQTFKLNTYVGDGSTISITGTIISVIFGYGLTSGGGALAVDRTKIKSRWAGTITGDGATTVFTLTHNLANSNPDLTLRDSSGNEYEIANQAINSNQIAVTFGNAPAVGVSYVVEIGG
ncbi:hypothetical protein [Methylosinus sp. PW1]|uniref:hypothetical protein n=1 Tax=Methylosinus sp. PW1 TaxID=107636 RepID=UPI00068B1436|nr:hypothetical protein [Methylosinus sp. PW1]